MKKLLILLILIFTPFLANARGLGMLMGGGVAAAAGATPDWQWNFEDNTTCTAAGKFDSVEGSPNCQNTTNSLDTYSMLLASGTSRWAQKAISLTGSELWVEYSTYTDGANFSDAAGRIFFDVCTAADCSTFAIRGGFALDTTYKYLAYRWGDSGYTYSSNAPTVGRLYWRWYLKRDNTTGIKKLSTSTDGTTWTEQFNGTGLDTDTGAAWVRILFGRNNAANFPENWYFDNIKIYYSSPGW
jgi:hypothetical protein